MANNFNKETKMADKDYVRLFLKRHPRNVYLNLKLSLTYYQAKTSAKSCVKKESETISTCKPSTSSFDPNVRALCGENYYCKTQIEDWIACQQCGIYYYESCATNYGITEDDGSFMCMLC